MRDFFRKAGNFLNNRGSGGGSLPSNVGSLDNSVFKGGSGNLGYSGSKFNTSTFNNDFFTNKGRQGISNRDAFGGGFNFGNAFSGQQALEGFQSLLDVSNAMGDQRQQNYQGGFSSDRGFNPSSIVGGGGGSVKLSPQSTFLAAPTRMAGGGGSAGGGGPSGFDKMLNRGVQLASIYAAFACDMRLKTDVSPLETTEVNDKLADMAFFVKELRECS